MQFLVPFIWPWRMRRKEEAAFRALPSTMIHAPISCPDRPFKPLAAYCLCKQELQLRWKEAMWLTFWHSYFLNPLWLRSVGNHKSSISQCKSSWILFFEIPIVCIFLIVQQKKRLILLFLNTAAAFWQLLAMLLFSLISLGPLWRAMLLKCILQPRESCWRRANCRGLSVQPFTGREEGVRQFSCISLLVKVAPNP